MKEYLWKDLSKSKEYLPKISILAHGLAQMQAIEVLGLKDKVPLDCIRLCEAGSYGTLGRPLHPDLPIDRCSSVPALRLHSMCYPCCCLWCRC